MKKLILAVILLSGFLVRLYRINTPLADWHSWRQADTAAVSRNFLKEGINLLYPKFDDLSNIPSGKDNPEGWRFVEFPIYNATHAIFFKFLKAVSPVSVSFEIAGRLVSVFSSLIAAVFLYLIIEEFLGWGVGVLSAFFFLFFPYNIYYSRVILPGPMMIALSLASVYLLIREKETIFWLLSLVLAAAAILVKPYAVFILAPSWLVIFGDNLLRSQNKKHYILRIVSYILLSCIPFFAWRLWMRQFPEGIPANQWLFNGGGIRFRPAWWRWLFAERLAKLILGYWGVVFFVLGLICGKGWKREKLFYAWLAGGFVYLAVFARGNVQHDYYQILLIPALSVFVAEGFYYLGTLAQGVFYKLNALVISVVVLLFMFAFSWYHIRDYYNINHPEIVEVGREADKILPKDAKVIAPYRGDTAFLYQTNRKGWPALTYPVEEMIKKGATHFVSVNFDELTQDLMRRCRIVKKSKQWVIIDLRKCYGGQKEN